MRKLYIVLWIMALAVGSIVWGLLMNSSLGYATNNFVTNLLMAMGMAILPFLISGFLSSITYFFKRTAFSVLITWTILLLIGLVFMGIGAAKM